MNNHPHATQDRSPGELRDFLTVIFKYKSSIAAVFGIIVATVTAVSFIIPPTYEAKSSLLVKFGREYTYRPEVNDKAPTISVNQEEAINSELNILTSRDMIDKVIATLHVKTIYPELLKSPLSSIFFPISPHDAAVIKFSKKLKVEVIKKTNVLQISFQHKDPQIAAKAVNLLVEFFKERHYQVYNGPESQFLEKQLSEFDQKLKESEKGLQRFKQKNGVYSLEVQRELLLKQRTGLDATLKASRSQIEGIQRRLASLNSQKTQLTEGKAHYTQSDRDQIIVDAKTQLLNLQLKERDYLVKYSNNSRLVNSVRTQIGLVTDFLREQEEDISKKVMTSNVVYLEAEKQALIAEADLNAELAQEHMLSQQLNQLDGQLAALDLKEKDLEDLKRDVATNEKNYRTYMDKFEEARISNDMNRQKLANLSVIQAATAPPKPIKPKKRLNIAIGIILGAVSGLGYAFLREYASQGFTDPEKAERRIGLPVLATVHLRR